MARLFGTVGDKVSLGSPAALDDLHKLGQMMIVATCRRNAAGSLMVASKGGAGAGWVFEMFTDTGVAGHLLFSVERATTDTIAISGSSSAGGVIPQDVHACVGVNWDTSQASGSNGIAFYGNPVETPVTTLNQHAGAAGSGTIGSDAAGDCYVGNYSGGSDFVFKGDIGWVVIKAKSGTTPWTKDEFQQVQAGILTCKAAREAGGALTRGLAIINASGAASLILELASDGTCTDHSSNAITATLTATTAGTEQTGWFAPTSFEDDIEPLHPGGGTDQTLYTYTSEFARKSFVTSATGFDVWARSTMPFTADDRVPQIGYLIDGVYTDEVRAAIAATEYIAGSVTGLSGSSKTVTFVNGMRASITGTRPWWGTFLSLVRFSSAATESSPATRTRPLVVCCDSALEGFYTDAAAKEGSIQKLRLNLPTTYDGIIMFGGGALSLHAIGADASARQATATLLCAANPRAILTNLAGNDWFNDYWTGVANYQAALSDFLDKLLAGFSGHVFVPGIFTPPSGSEYEGDNGSGDDIADYRAAISTVCASKGLRVSYLPLTTVVSEANFDTDLKHPNVAGNDEIYTYLLSQVRLKLLLKLMAA